MNNYEKCLLVKLFAIKCHHNSITDQSDKLLFNTFWVRIGIGYKCIDKMHQSIQNQIKQKPFHELIRDLDFINVGEYLFLNDHLNRYHVSCFKYL